MSGNGDKQPPAEDPPSGPSGGQAPNSGTKRSPSRLYRAIAALAALDKSDFEGALRGVLARDAQELDIERVNCWVVQQEPPAIRCISGYLRSAGAYESGAVIEARHYPRYFQALSEDPIILADEAQTDARTSEFAESYLEPLGIRAMMDVPIWVRGELWGVVCHEHVGGPRHWTNADRDFAMSIGHILSGAVEARERAEAERVAKFGELFMGMLGHDLRNPLNTIRMSAESLLRGPYDEKTSNNVDRIVRSIEHMNRMIEQILDFTRARVGNGIPVQPERTDLAELCRRVAADLVLGFPGRSIDVHVSGDPIGIWDPDRLWQVISNLVSNALEHGAPQGPLGLRVEGEDPDLVVVQVINRGTIPPHLLHVVFDPFRRAQATSSHRRGLGLGLYIARQIVSAHAGVITAECRDGQTFFTVRLPRRTPQNVA